MVRILAWLSFAFLLAGPQGFAGWKHSSLHGPCRTASSDHPGANHCDADEKLGISGCWICTSTILGAADSCDPTIAITFAPPALEQVIASCDLISSCFQRNFSARAPPLS